MGYEKPPPKLTIYKAFFSAQWKFLIHTLVQCLSVKRTAWNDTVRNVDSPSKFLMYPRFLQVVMDHQVDGMTSHNTRYTSHALSQKVFVKMRRVGKGFSGGCIQTGGKIAAIDANEDITLVDVETDKKVVAMDAETQGRLNQECW
nr:hypothetical protein [Tanacetum cinerariifolium]